MWDFEHPPLAAALAEHYTLHYTHPRCPPSSSSIPPLSCGTSTPRLSPPHLLNTTPCTTLSHPSAPKNSLAVAPTSASSPSHPSLPTSPSSPAARSEER